MTTQEQLKIYAAYLPYNLKFKANNEIWQLTDIRTIDEYPIWASNIWNEETLKYEPKINLKPDGCLGHGFLFEECKPVLYDLSHLTKEIEHEGERFIPVQKLRQHCIEELGAKDYDTDIGIDKLVKGWELIYWPKLFIDKLLEWHFNVFGIPAGDFIDKSTLKTESND